MSLMVLWPVQYSQMTLPHPVQSVVAPSAQIQQHRLALHTRALHIGAGPENGSSQHGAVERHALRRWDVETLAVGPTWAGPP